MFKETTTETLETHGLLEDLGSRGRTDQWLAGLVPFEIKESQHNLFCLLNLKFDGL